MLELQLISKPASPITEFQPKDHTELKLADQLDFLNLPYHQAILNDEIPLSIGGGIGQARTYMYLLRTAHLGEVTVSIWPEQLKKICKEKNIEILE